MEFKTYPRIGSIDTAQVRLSLAKLHEMNVSVSPADEANIKEIEYETGQPVMGCIARNPDNHEDRWWIAPAYFAKNYDDSVEFAGETICPTFPERDPSKSTEEQGLFRKFDVTRTDGSSAKGGRHCGCAYFVLDIDCDPFAIPALQAYADACNEQYPELASDLFDIIEHDKSYTLR